MAKDVQGTNGGKIVKKRRKENQKEGTMAVKWSTIARKGIGERQIFQIKHLRFYKKNIQTLKSQWLLKENDVSSSAHKAIVKKRYISAYERLLIQHTENQKVAMIKPE